MDDTQVKHGEKFIQDVQKKHSFSVCIFLILCITYYLSSYYYTYICKLTMLDPVAYQLIFTSTISFVGFFAFPPFQRNTSFKSQKKATEVDTSYCVQDRQPSNIKRFWRRFNRLFDDFDVILCLCTIALTPVIIHLLDSLFINIFNLKPNSFGNQQNLNEQIKSSSFVLAFLWIGFSAPIVEELFLDKSLLASSPRD